MTTWCSAYLTILHIQMSVVAPDRYKIFPSCLGVLRLDTESVRIVLSLPGSLLPCRTRYDVELLQ